MILGPTASAPLVWLRGKESSIRFSKQKEVRLPASRVGGKVGTKRFTVEPTAHIVELFESLLPLGASRPLRLVLKDFLQWLFESGRDLEGQLERRGILPGFDRDNRLAADSRELG